MQLCLSHLVDLALGHPELIKGENFNILHTVLHVILKKLNLSDAPVEINDESAEKAKEILNGLPNDPSITFKEFIIRNGVRVKKRNSHQLTGKRSVIQVNKKWPKFASNHCTSPVTPPPKIDSKIMLDDLDSLSQRVISLETKLFDITQNIEAQNCDALANFEKLKVNLEELTCELQENKKSTIETEEEQPENESVCENDVDYVEEIKWLKERMLEFSASLKIQSECLKNLKCRELPQISNKLDEKWEWMEKSLQSLKKSHKQLGKNELEEIKAQFEKFKCQMQEFEKQFLENKEMTSDEIATLRHEVMEKIRRAFDSSLIFAESSETQNSDDHCALKLSDTPTDQSIPNSLTQNVCHIQKQVMSHSVCMQQIVRDLACKIDRQEFDNHCRKIGDSIDSFTQLKKEFQTSGINAAGSSSKICCLSCQTLSNMTTTTSNIPKLPHLKYGRENIVMNELGGGCCVNNCCGLRRVGGCHTKSFPDFHQMQHRRNH